MRPASRRQYISPILSKHLPASGEDADHVVVVSAIMTTLLRGRVRTGVTEATKPGSTLPSFTSSSVAGSIVRAAIMDAFRVSRTILKFCSTAKGEGGACPGMASLCSNMTG